MIGLLTGSHANADVRRNSKDDFHLKLLLRFGLRPTSNYLDVGANQGHFLKGIQAVAPLGHHIAYEPLPHLCIKLSQQFPAWRFVRRHCRTGRVKLRSSTSWSGQSGLQQPRRRWIEEAGISG